MLLQESKDQKHDKRPDLIYDEKLMKFMPITVTALMLILFVFNLLIPIDNVGVALILIALLPWLLPFIVQINLPGGGSIQLRNVKEELEKQRDKIREQDQKIEDQGNEIKEQRKISDELALAIYSLGENIYRHLKGIVKAQERGERYMFFNNDTMPHDFKFLIDSGYIKWFDFGFWNNKDLVGADFVTPAGRMLVQLREKYTGAEP